MLTAQLGEPLIRAGPPWSRPFLYVEAVALSGRTMRSQPHTRSGLAVDWKGLLSVQDVLALKKGQALGRVRRHVLVLGWVVSKGFVGLGIRNHGRGGWNCSGHGDPQTYIS